MPHFNDQGQDTAICQLCGTITTQVKWRPDLTPTKSACNVCQTCQDKADGKPQRGGVLSLAEHCAQESGHPLGSMELTKYINRYYGHG